ncbi:MAG: DNA-directed RNA polymerase subunit alpha [bacterium]|nr:DNA-directed RNA polymerase subunit alpha [bacterium]
MIPLSKPAKLISSAKNVGTFEIDGLYPGYGHTVANSLRRVLLSSLEGAAITQVKIKGASHEFSTLPGIREDVVTILLNLKQLRFKVFSDEPQTATLKMKGERIVKSKDFDLSSQVELMNGDQEICTITDKKAELNVEVQIEKGIGYEASEDRKLAKREAGVISLDAIYTPVQRVAFKVENARVGDRTDFNKVSLEIETDGTLSPEAALEQACDILVKEFSQIKEGVEGASQVVEKKAPVKKKATAAKKKAPAKKVSSKKK